MGFPREALLWIRFHETSDPNFIEFPITKSIGSWFTLASDDWTNWLIPIILHPILRVIEH